MTKITSFQADREGTWVAARARGRKESKMKLLETTGGRLLLGTLALLLIGGGLLPLLGVSLTYAAPILFLLSVATGIGGLYWEVATNPHVALVTILAYPMTLWPATILVFVAEGRAWVSGLMIVAGLVPVAMLVASLVRAPKKIEAATSEQRPATAH